MNLQPDQIISLDSDSLKELLAAVYEQDVTDYVNVSDTHITFKSFEDFYNSTQLKDHIYHIPVHIEVIKFLQNLSTRPKQDGDLVYSLGGTSWFKIQRVSPVSEN